MFKPTAAALICSAASYAQDKVDIQKQLADKLKAETRVAFISADFLPEQTVAGAPFSADETTTTTQTLLDGNRIVHASTTKVYRDDQGRTRTEHSLGNIGSLAADQPGTLVSISDPVANVRYSLEKNTRTAYKSAATGQGDKWFAEQKNIETRTITLRGAPGSDAMPGPAPLIYTTTNVHLAGSAKTGAKSEDLGTSNMEGVQVKGTRTTTTIPAGAEGNDRDLNIVGERWYSPELKMNIMTKHTDPRSGETVFQVTNLTRGNPDSSLFQVPSDYQIKDGARGNATFKFTTKSDTKE